MFKKSEEQEWTRFRGALSKDRDDTATAPATMPEPVETNNSSASPATPANTPSAGPSFRTLPGDVNVGLPSPRLTRSVVSDAGEVESLIGEHTHFEGTLGSNQPWDDVCPGARAGGHHPGCARHPRCGSVAGLG